MLFLELRSNFARGAGYLRGCAEWKFDGCWGVEGRNGEGYAEEHVDFCVTTEIFFVQEDAVRE